MGLLIDEGEVDESAYGTAGKWFKRGCELGDLPSCHNAGVAHEYGKSGLAKDYEQAQTYYRKAAESGYMQSRYNLASLYANEYFQADAEGYKWLLISQAQARECSGEALCRWVLRDPPGHKTALEGRMSSREIDGAKAQASEWAPGA